MFILRFHINLKKALFHFVIKKKNCPKTLKDFQISTNQKSI